MNPLVVPTKRIKIIFAVLILIVLALIGVVVFLFMKSPKTPTALPANPPVSAATTDQVITEVGKVLVLPQDELPKVYTVSDLTALKGVPFFVDAQIGDQVLIYAVSKKAVLWRPSVKKVVSVSELNISAQ